MSGTTSLEHLRRFGNAMPRLQAENTGQIKPLNRSETKSLKEQSFAAKRSDSFPQSDAHDIRKPDIERDEPRLGIIEFTDPWGDRYYVRKADFDLAKFQDAQQVKTCTSSGNAINARQDVSHLRLVLLEFARRRDYVVSRKAQTDLPAFSAVKAEFQHPKETSIGHSSSAIFEDDMADESSAERVSADDLGQTQRHMTRKFLPRTRI